MTADKFINEIRDTNLSYLVLAQAMIRADKPQALFRLGLSEAVADMIVQMSPQQLVRIASRASLVCGFRFDDELIWGLLTDNHDPRAAQEANADRLHASVLMAGRHVATMAA